MWTVCALAFFSPTGGHLSLVRTAAAQSAEELIGTWEGYGPSDSRAKQYTILELRADGTYTKTLDAVVDGKHYGGTHSGTFKSRGLLVYLSGDGNYGPYTQDLRYLKKVK
jgi:hypothetical protein